MKKQLFLLYALTCFSLTSGLCSSHPPDKELKVHEPSNRQTATDQMPFTEFTLSNYRVDGLEVAHLVAYEPTIDAVKVDEDYTSCAMSAPVKDVQFVDTSTNVIHPITSMIDKRNIPQLNFNYIEGRATEYRS